MNEVEVYGLVAEFDDPTRSGGSGARSKTARVIERFEAYTPYPIKDLDEIIPGRNLVPPIVLIGGFIGAAMAWSMEYYIAAIDYPINVGGRPLYSWPMFIPILFELRCCLQGHSHFSARWRCAVCRGHIFRCSICPSSAARRAAASSCASRSATRGTIPSGRPAFFEISIR